MLDRDKYIAGRKNDVDQREAFGVIRRVNKSEATDCTHVHMKVIGSVKGEFCALEIGQWRLVSMDVNQYKRHEVFASTPAFKVFRMLIAKSSKEHGHRKVIAILEAADAFFHADIDDVIYAHPPADAAPDRTVVWLLLKAHYGTRTVARLWP